MLRHAIQPATARFVHRRMEVTAGKVFGEVQSKASILAEKDGNGYVVYLV